MSAVTEPTPTAEPEYILIREPADGIPGVVDTPQALRKATEALLAGSGPLAVDAERAQGFRYSAKAYLIQLRRDGAPTVLLDPVALEDVRERADLSELATALSDVEWIIHAASQDLPSLAEINLLPRRLFDTELGGRLLGLPKVSLTALTERALGKTLAKEHSAADWSKRPIPADWLGYAALDVELLGDLRDWVAAELDAAGKTEWARQEFAYLVERAGDPPVRREEPWRRTSGIHELRSPAQLAVVRELWLTRDEIARRTDRAPGRVLPDAAISDLAGRLKPDGTPLTRTDMRAVRGFHWRVAARYETSFADALGRVAAMSRSDFPSTSQQSDGPPPPRTWARRYPEAFARWSRLRPATVSIAEENHLPVENVIAPDTIRRLAWEPPAAVESDVEAFLAERGARPWQRELLVDPLTATLRELAADQDSGSAD